MLVDTIQSELVRLQIHPVNLGVTSEDDQTMALRGSLLRYWKVPETVEAHWFLDVLKGLPNDAGPAVVMTAFCAAHAAQVEAVEDHEGGAARTPADAAASEATFGEQQARQDRCNALEAP